VQFDADLDREYGKDVPYLKLGPHAVEYQAPAQSLQASRFWVDHRREDTDSGYAFREDLAWVREANLRHSEV
jgi:hypothetical protein